MTTRKQRKRGPWNRHALIDAGLGHLITRGNKLPHKIGLPLADFFMLEHPDPNHVIVVKPEFVEVYKLPGDPQLFNWCRIGGEGYNTASRLVHLVRDLIEEA